MDTPFDDTEEWEEVVLLSALVILTWVLVISLESVNRCFKFCLVLGNVSVSETMRLHSLELGQELGWVLQEELNIDVGRLVAVSQDTDEGLHCFDELLWGRLGEDHVEISKLFSGDLCTGLLSSFLGWGWVFVGVLELSLLFRDGFFERSDFILSVCLLFLVLLEFSLEFGEVFS